MFCPECSWNDSRVRDSQSFLNGHVVRRKRECLSFSSRFISYEIAEHDLTSKKVMTDLYAKLTLEIKTQTFNQIGLIKKELDMVSMRLKKIKNIFS